MTVGVVRSLKIILAILFFLLLTTLTQIGGIVFLFSLIFFRIFDLFVQARARAVRLAILSFIILYGVATLVLVPSLALKFGRVALPLFGRQNLQPANIMTGILNRRYVRPPLREVAFNVAETLATRYPGASLNYLDANFPFFDGFPLFPHLSHSDGKKLDVSFQYNDSNGRVTAGVPSFIGYGICEEPASGEEDRPALCASQGYWQYSVLRNYIPQGNRIKFVFDAQRTADMVNAFAAEWRIGKIFIEPHLKTRLKLTSEKIRFHGCQAVRHDDHVHVQLK